MLYCKIEAAILAEMLYCKIEAARFDDMLYCKWGQQHWI
jgi:hypothetical protein